MLEAYTRELEEPRKTSWRAPLARAQHIAVPLGIYAVSRLISAIFLSIGASRQAQVANQSGHYVHGGPIPASPGYWGVMANYDGQWYKAIALDGYPTVLPVEGGHVLRNVWAFYPLFPELTRGLMRLTGTSFEVAGGLLSLTCGAVAVVLLYGLLRRRMSVFAAGSTTAALCCFPTSPILQVCYSEGVTLLLLVITVWALQSRRYGLFSASVIVLSLARPIALPLTLVTLVHWIGRWRKSGLPCTVRSWIKPVCTIAVTAASTFLWPLIAWLSTGEPRAFFMTQEAWRLSNSRSVLSASPLGQALESSWRLFAVAFLLLAMFVFLALSSAARRWGPELRAWVAVYPLYIALMTQPTMSLLRYLMLALVSWWPLPGAGEIQENPRERQLLLWSILAMILSIELTVQHVWVTAIFTIDISPARQGIP